MKKTGFAMLSGLIFLAAQVFAAENCPAGKSWDKQTQDCRDSFTSQTERRESDTVTTEALDGVPASHTMAGTTDRNDNFTATAVHNVGGETDVDVSNQSPLLENSSSASAGSMTASR